MSQNHIKVNQLKLIIIIFSLKTETCISSDWNLRTSELPQNKKINELHSLNPPLPESVSLSSWFPAGGEGCSHLLGAFAQTLLQPYSSG